MLVAMANEHTLELHPVAITASGHELALHVHRLRGGGEGPTLGLVAGIHGDEPLGVETIRRALAELERRRSEAS
jgi:predicted deacylase